MIKIDIDDATREFIQTKHYNDVKKSVETIIENAKGNTKYKKIQTYFCDIFGKINDKRLEKLIIGNRSDLIEIINFIGVIPLVKNDPFDKLYKNFTKRVWSKLLLDKLNVEVCPYCNRNYIFNLKNAGIRPDFDHFFPKSQFSYLSASLYNLVPCCSLCNTKKHDLNTYTNDIYYPYEDEFGLEVNFQTHPIDNDFSYWTGVSEDFDIKIISIDKKHNRRVENVNEYLKIELLYNEHKSHVMNIIRKAIMYNDSQIDEYLLEYPQLFKSETDILNTVFMTNMDKESWGKCALSKLTHDIYKEFNMFPRK